VDELARMLAVSRSLLYLRLAPTGVSPARLILDHRMLRAAGLLRCAARSVGEVAFLVGFKSVSHFCRCFRDRFGRTPAAFLRGES
jgi:AraC-like DNA-binding protein